MARHALFRERRIGHKQRSDEMRKRLVLRSLIGKLVGALKLDANREIIAAGPALKLRLASVPGARSEWHVLHDLPVAPDERVRRHAQLRDLRKIRMRVGCKTARKELINPGAAELARRQTDAMHNDEVRGDTRGARVKMRRQHLAHPGEKPRGPINLHAWNNATIALRHAENAPMSDSNASYVARDLAHVWHPCTQMKDHEQDVPLVPIRRGQGVWLEDFAGRRYLDAVSSWWVNLFGHANPRINAAISAQLGELEHVILAGFTHEPVIALSAALVKVAPPGLSRCFYADNGSSAVEVAVKMSFHYWRNVGQTKKRGFITLANSYHGETLGALAVGDVELYKAIYKPLLMEVRVVGSPDCYAREPGVTWAAHSISQFAHMEEALARHHEETAAVIVEPLVQCAGSMRMYDPVYLKLLRAACDRYGVHLIADEVAVGFGRTGTLFACEQAAISPDFLCLSKGLTGGYLPLSVVMTTEDVYAAFYDEYVKLNAFLHSHSYSGNPLACAAALASLAIFDADKVLERNRVLAAHMGNRARVLEEHPHVAEVRQHGMITAIEFLKNKAAREPYPWQERRGLKVYRHGLTRGVLLRPIGNVVYFMPPYVITPEEIDLMVTVAHEGIAKATCD